VPGSYVHVMDRRQYELVLARYSHTVQRGGT
jgi:hypothetical protein